MFNVFRSGDSPKLRFLQPLGQGSVLHELEALLASGTTSLRAAVCFFTEPGRILLSRHIPRLRQANSFFVACVAFPTNLDSLLALHYAAPGHVYIHLGGTTPKERTVGRSLMHSKVFLAEGERHCELWVGSHNLTAMAVEGGNFEAGLIFHGPSSEQAIQDARSHLESCRTSAELFDPDQMDRYREIQNGWSTDKEWESEKDVIVIHAEAHDIPDEESFISHIRVVPEKFDRLFRTDRAIRLFVHPIGSLKCRETVDFEHARMWSGRITGVVRTDLHLSNRGAAAFFEDAKYDIDVSDLDSTPKLLPGGTSCIEPRTQVVIRTDAFGVVGKEVYSLSDKSPIQNVLGGRQALRLHNVDRELKPFFTAESLSEDALIYRPASEMRHNVVVTGFDATIRAGVPPELWKDDSTSDDMKPLACAIRTQRDPIDPFFFLSKYVVRRKKSADQNDSGE